MMTTLTTTDILRIYSDLGRTPGPIENRQHEEAMQLLIAYNARDTSFTHKLSVVQFGYNWVGVDFDSDKSCWYNPENRYPQMATFYDAVVTALAVRLGMMPVKVRTYVETHKSFDPHAR
jgi:hypothetical protein